MRYVFDFPDIGEGLEEGKIIEWYVKEGQSINSGDQVVKMETDKVVTDIPSPKKGTVVKLYGNPGDTVNVGSPLLELNIEGIDGKKAQETAKEKPRKQTQEQVDEKGFGVVGTLEVAGNGGHLPSSKEGMNQDSENKNLPNNRKVLATPVARAMAKDYGVDINLIEGTGPGGRVMKKDIKNFYQKNKKASQKETQTNETEKIEYETLSQIRKAIAKNMINSKHKAAHMSVFEEVEISELIRIRKEYKEQFKQKGAKLTYLPFILKALAQSLKNHKSLNSELDMENNRLIYKKYYNIGIAVDTDDGLLVPVIKDVDKKTILELSHEVNKISEKSRNRELSFDDMKDGTFTITNYGAIGGIFAVPVINYPQAGIIGIGRIMKKPIVKNNQITIGKILPISLSVDHRIVDGGEVGRFVNEIKQYLTDPISLLMY